ncbi:MAG: hypothetical protein JST96_10570 [Bacteroidetes bacterium]|nr:hypothetical protein [Bacteroidota bacterium]
MRYCTVPGAQEIFVTGITVAFNFSDPFPCGTAYIFLSATRSDAKGGYDLYIADVKSGKIWPMDYYNTSINSGNNELGSCYTDK